VEWHLQPSGHRYDGYDLYLLPVRCGVRASFVLNAEGFRRKVAVMTILHNNVVKVIGQFKKTKYINEFIDLGCGGAAH